VRDIPPGEEITIDYDAQASPTSKLAGLAFWQWQPPKSPKCAPGMKRIQCGCAGPGQRCPNRLWRDERVTRAVKHSHNNGVENADGNVRQRTTKTSVHDEGAAQRSAQSNTPPLLRQQLTRQTSRLPRTNTTVPQQTNRQNHCVQQVMPAAHSRQKNQDGQCNTKM